MKILIVANYNPGRFSTFVVEQMTALKKCGCEIQTFGIVGKGLLGYLKNLPALKQTIKEFRPDIIHAHYGLSGLLATLQRDAPVVTTYHGSDIHSRGWVLRLSQLCMKRSAYNLFVSSDLRKIANYRGENGQIIPCGIDIDTFYPMDKESAIKSIGWSQNARHILFAGAFNRAVKNAPLAQEAITRIPDCQLIELKNFDRKEVRLALNACDSLLMTSFNEGSPMIIKEAMACGTPIVTVDVGDVNAVLGKTQGCYLVKYDAEDIAAKIKSALRFNQKTDGRQRLINLGLTNDLVTQKIVEVYRKILKKTSSTAIL
jgi:glycosyltransferase involved in cell wall biosynthesis